MRINRTKKIFISIAVCAMLLPFFAFFSVLPVNALEPGVYTPEDTAEFNRMLQQNNQAKPNEEISGKARPEYDDACGWFQFSCYLEKIVSGALNGIVDFILFLPLQISQYFLDWMLMTNLNGAAYRSGFVMIGWGISRDVANMFFIFFVLWMALATIFQFDSYSAKRLLPKLIIVALLVNFSLPIGLFVINVSNSIAKAFYDAAIQEDSLAQRIGEIAQITDTKQAAEFSVEHPPETVISDESCDLQIMNSQASGTKSDRTQIATAYNNCIKGKLAEKAKADGGLFTNILIAVFWKLIIGLVASFVFFAGAIFLLVRYLSLVILLIFGPLAFLFMILPATQEHWNKWWNKLVQWSFFAPAFMFMIMLSVQLSSTLLTFQTQAAENIVDKGDLPSLAMQYVLVMGLFIASLMVANSMGIAMSGTVVGWGRSMARGAGRYAKGQGIQKAKIVAGGVAGGIQSNALLQKTLSSIPLLGGSIARGLGATRAMGEVAEKQRQRQKFGFAEKLSDEARGNYIASERAGVARDLLTKMDESDRRRTVNALSTQGQIELAQKLRSVQSESLVGNTTNNPEVYARLSGEAGPLDSKGYLEKVAKIAHDKFQAKNLAPDFLRGATGREYLKTATEDELKAIAGTRQGAEALGGTLAEIARTMHEEAQAYITSPAGIVHQNVVPKDYEQHVANIKNQYLSPQTQRYLNTAPGMYEGRMAMKTRGGGEKDAEDEDEQFMRRIRKAAKSGFLKSPEE